MSTVDRSLVRRCLIGVALAGTLALPASAQAGRLVVTGHDADGHCVREEIASQPASCGFVAASVNWVRAAAPDPRKPVLILDRGPLDFKKSVDVMNAAGASVPYIVVEPRSPAFAGVPITTANFSAVLIASSKNGPTDPTQQGLNEYTSTPDTDAINARRADLAAFFNAGGGIDVMSGGVAGRTDSARYYAFLHITRGGANVLTPFGLTAIGRAIGFQDARAFPRELNSINCCDTHLSFELSAPESPLKVAEFDSSERAVTMVAQTNNLATIEEPPVTAQTVFGDIAGVPPAGTAPPAGSGPSTIVAKTSCITKKFLKISLRRPKGVRFTRMMIFVNGKLKRDVSGRRLGTGRTTRPVRIQISTKKSSKVKIIVRTAAGRQLRYLRRYKPCGK